MAATFVVEDGTSKSTANSYLSVAAADQYWEDHGAPAAWTAASQAEEEAALRMATQYLDVMWGAIWQGYASDMEQALDWPRWPVTGHSGYGWDSDEMPQPLLDAAAELALRHLTETDGLMPDSDDSAGVRKRTVRVGPITESIEYAGADAPQKTFAKVEELVAELLSPAALGEIVRC